MKTLAEKDFEANAPETPIPYGRYQNAWRAEIDLRQAIGDAKHLLCGKSNGLKIAVNDYELWGQTKQETEAVFRIAANCVLQRLAYCESRLSRYVEIPKDMKRDLQSFRVQIDEYFNA